MGLSKWIAGAGLAFMTATAATAGAPAFPAHASGDWAGKVQAGDGTKHLFVHIHGTRAGGYTATLDIPGYGAGAVAATPLDAPEGVLAFSAADGQFRGQWDQAQARWEGTWTEAGVSAPLVLSLNGDSSSGPRLATHSATPLVTLTSPAPGPVPVSPPEIVPPSAR